MTRQKTAVRQIFIVVLFAIFFVGIASSIYIHLDYAATMPTSPQPETGRIYSIKVNHGFVRFVTKKELDFANFVFEKLFVFGMAAFGLAMLLEFYFPRRAK